jgi:hypothetical protein
MSKYQIIKGSDFFPSIDTLTENKPVNIYFYQIAQFSDNENNTSSQLSKSSNIYNIRAYKFKGVGGSNQGYGNCMYSYDIIDINDYKLSKRNVDKFVEKIKIKGDVEGAKIGSGTGYKYVNKNKNNNNNNSTTLYKYKFYPVYNFNETPPPQGYEINECTSELLL